MNALQRRTGISPLSPPQTQTHTTWPVCLFPPVHPQQHTYNNNNKQPWDRQQHTTGCPATTHRHHTRRCASMRVLAQANVMHTTPPQTDDQTHSDPVTPSSIQQESLRVLEWPAVCKQVASFCGTVMAAQALAQGHLPVGHSQAQSELLLQQTDEALQLGLKVSGFYDMHPALDAVTDGLCLNAKQLQGVAGTLETALRVRSQVCQRSSSGSSQGGGNAQSEDSAQGEGGFVYPSLAPLAAGIAGEEEQTLRALQLCIQAGSVSDQASKSLADARARRRQNTEALRKLMDEQARVLLQKGASDSKLVSLMRGRFCVGIKAGRQGDLPRKSVKLGVSQTGATQYWEPQPAIELNNAEAGLAAEEAERETEVLVLLSQLVASRAPSIRAMQDSIIQLDIIAARAQHAKWMSGTRPVLVSTQGYSFENSTQDSGLIRVPGALHPLLLASALPPTPNPPSPDDNRFERNFVEPPSWESKRSVLGGVTGPDSNGSGKGGKGRGRRPHALDLRVAGDKQVIAITGPNTGGKTVALKTTGLMILMAKAGLFLSVDAKQVEQHGPPHVAWFASVLADIGDSQSLQQNLSTFGGHVKRLRQVVDAADSGSLVLLDEVGSGTDPVEGAALAKAILRHLSDKALMTMATTHHAELKRLADEDARYMNVSLGFDTASLQPTYQLMWGAAGASNALDIARTLGFDGAVLREAQVIARTTMEAESSRSARMAATAASLVKQLEESHIEVQEVQEERAKLEAKQQKLLDDIKETESLMQRLKMSPRTILEQRNKLQTKMNAALDAYKAKQILLPELKARIKELEDLIPERVGKYKKKQSYQDDDAPRPGDSVFVTGYNENGSVEQVTGEFVYVQLQGSLGMMGGLLGGGNSKKQKMKGTKVRLADVRITKRAAPSPSKPASKAAAVSPAPPAPPAPSTTAPLPTSPAAPEDLGPIADEPATTTSSSTAEADSSEGEMIAANEQESDGYDSFQPSPDQSDSEDTEDSSLSDNLDALQNCPSIDVRGLGHVEAVDLVFGEISVLEPGEVLKVEYEHSEYATEYVRTLVTQHAYQKLLVSKWIDFPDRGFLVLLATDDAQRDVCQTRHPLSRSVKG